MSLIFNPKLEMGLNCDARLVIYDLVKKEFIIKQLIKVNEVYELEEKVILEDPFRYKYKYQIVENSKWVDISKYKALLNEKELLDFLLDKTKDINIKELVGNWKNGDSETYCSILQKTAYNFMRVFWTNKNFPFNNAYKLIEYYKVGNPIDNSPFNNFILQIKYYLLLREKFASLGLNNKSYENIYKELVQESKIKIELQSVLNDLEIYSENIQMANVLKGKLESFLNQRDEAHNTFKKALEFERDHIKVFNFDQGVYTFQKDVKSAIEESSISYIDKVRKSETTFLISVDEKFLRFYGASLMFTISVLKNYHFHFHIIGEPSEVLKVVEDTKTLYKDICKYRGANSLYTEPTFSVENMPPYILDKKTFFACSRYIHAEKFMIDFDCNLYIMDADLMVLSDLNDYIMSLKKFDVALPFSSGIVSLCPWRRVLAGNVFVKNNNNGKFFISQVTEYIKNNIGLPIAWTLDQNALSYAYEQSNKNKDFKIEFGNCNKFTRPMVQGAIRKQIEII
ncbi:hypothetical protein QNK12_27080 [Neobacillus cucumis]|nr:hypothetical protein QNK12_27080 [Neobacillus cucumis]